MSHHRTQLPYSDKVETMYRKILRFLELTVAAVTVVVLVIGLAVNVWKFFANPAGFQDTSNFLHAILNIVVGLEFVRMLIDTTPANILEVLTVAITRYVILSHDDYWSNVASVACIAGLFAIRRFLIHRSELQEEMVDVE